MSSGPVQVDSSAAAALLTCSSSSDFHSAILTLVISIYAIANRYVISPALIGVILSSTLQIQQAFSMVVRQATEVENNMSSVERLHVYGSKLIQEAPSILPGDPDAKRWPNQGVIEFRDVKFRYRPDLPVVLHLDNLKVGAGEHVGICGRTGAGKSTILHCLWRLVELDAEEGGSTHIDGLDISTLGVSQLTRLVCPVTS